MTVHAMSAEAHGRGGREVVASASAVCPECDAQIDVSTSRDPFTVTRIRGKVIVKWSGVICACGESFTIEYEEGY